MRWLKLKLQKIKCYFGYHYYLRYNTNLGSFSICSCCRQNKSERDKKVMDNIIAQAFIKTVR